MILECPSCESKFKIPTGAITEAGRKVRCANCQNIWHATFHDVFKPQPIILSSAIVDDRDKDVAVDTDIEAEQPSSLQINADVAAQGQQASVLSDVDIPENDHQSDSDQKVDKVSGQPVQNLDDDVVEQATDFIATIKSGLEEVDFEEGDFATVDGMEGREEDYLARRRTEQRKDLKKLLLLRKRKFITIGWAVLIVFWVSLITTFFFFKDSVVAFFPAANALYSSAENADYTEEFQPVEGEVLTAPITESVTRLEAYILPPPTLENVDGRRILIVRGYVENKGVRAATVPQLELQVLDNRGRVIQNWVHEPEGSIITRGTKLNFETTLSPVPAGVVRAVVKVIEGSKSSARAEYS